MPATISHVFFAFALTVWLICSTTSRITYNRRITDFDAEGWQDMYVYAQHLLPQAQADISPLSHGSGEL